MFPILLGKTNELEAKCADLQEQINAGGGGSSGSGVLIVTDTDGTLDKTWQEIYDAGFAVLHISSAVAVLCYIYSNVSHGEYFLNFFDGEETLSYNATSADSYPTISE